MFGRKTNNALENNDAQKDMTHQEKSLMLKGIFMTLFLLILIIIAVMIGQMNAEGLRNTFENFISEQCPAGYINYSIAPGGMAAGFWINNGVSDFGSMNINTSGVAQHG